MQCKTCPFLLLCNMPCMAFIHNTLNIFICPCCEKVIHSCWCKNEYFIYAYFCKKRRITPLIKQHWNKVQCSFTTKDTITDSSILVMECIECSDQRRGTTTKQHYYTRIDFNNGHKL